MERGILEIDKALDDLALDPLEVLPSLPPLPFHTTITIVCVCIYICIYTCMYIVCVYILHAYVYTYIYAYVYICIHIHVYIHIHIYLCIYTYICIYPALDRPEVCVCEVLPSPPPLLFHTTVTTVCVYTYM